MMAHFMVATDRLVRRKRIQVYRYQWQERRSWTEERLFAKPNRAASREELAFGSKPRVCPPHPCRDPAARLFSGVTRNHLRRRVWRYFRELSRRDAPAYRAAMRTALSEYTDEDLAAGENILDCWSLMHCCYFHSDCVTFNADHTNLAEDASLSNLKSAPYQPELWRASDAYDDLIEVLLVSRSTLVRLWAAETLQAMHAESLRSIEIEQLIRLMSHPDTRLQELAAELFAQHHSLSSLELSVWLRLVHQSNPAVLPLLCDAMQQHVAAERLSDQQLVDLVRARPTIVAQLGLEWLQVRHEESPLSNADLLPLANPQCPQMAAVIASWALSIVGSADRYRVDETIEFLDAEQRAVRSVAVDWLFDSTLPAFDDPAFWIRAMETPYDDVKIRIVEFLSRRAARRNAEGTSLNSIWTSIILNVERGNRTKPKAVRQITEAIVDNPARADQLMPVVCIGIRSIRDTERRAALSAIVRMAMVDETLRAKVSQHLPELEWVGVAKT